MDVREAGIAAGLVDVKVVSFSPVETGLKFVIPLKRRKNEAQLNPARRVSRRRV